MPEQHSLAEILHIQRRLRRLRRLRRSTGLHLRLLPRRLQRKNLRFLLNVIEKNRLARRWIGDDGLVPLIDVSFAVRGSKQFERYLFRLGGARMFERARKLGAQRRRLFGSGKHKIRERSRSTRRHR